MNKIKTSPSAKLKKSKSPRKKKAKRKGSCKSIMYHLFSLSFLTKSLDLKLFVKFLIDDEIK